MLDVARGGVVSWRGLRRVSAATGGLGSRGRIDVTAVVRWLQERSGGWVDGVWTVPQIATARVVGNAFSVPESHALGVLERACRERWDVMDRVKVSTGIVAYGAGISAVSAARGLAMNLLCAEVAHIGRKVGLTCTRRANPVGMKHATWSAEYVTDRVAEEGWAVIPNDYDAVQ